VAGGMLRAYGEQGMAKGVPAKAKVGVPGRTVGIDTAVYFLGTRMERNGMLRPGQALMLAATLPNTTKPRARGNAKRGKGK
jgi:hypothetical protein